VAIELLKIFLEQGAPVILQSDNGREFTAEVIKELVALWPECKLVHGRPRHPQSQGSIERSNQDVEQMLRIWMEENKTSSWSVGCYFVQWQKNTSYHRIIGRTPYKSLYGADPKIGLRSTNLPSDIIDKIFTEEDLDNIVKNVNLDDDIGHTLYNDNDTIVAANIHAREIGSSGNSTALLL
jgi:transposase InsO family protein